MSSGADLFVVCKQCGSEVSPYITECPYCGHRLRRRAPKLPSQNAPSKAPRGLSHRLRLRRTRTATSSLAAPRRRLSRVGTRSAVGSPPYATIALVAAGCAAWVVLRGGFLSWDKLALDGPISGDWWKLFTSQFAYLNGWYAFLALATIAIFGWLLERRRGPVVVLALSLGASATAVLVAGAVYSEPIVGGGNAVALALLAAWAAPDLRAARGGYHYEGDLLGAGAIAAVLLAIPFALEPPEASWLAGVVGGALGLLVGLGLNTLDPDDA